MANEQDFEQQLKQLEELVTRMESGELSLEASLQAFEQGVQLTRNCQQLLNQAEQRVSRLQESQGQVSFEPLTNGGQTD
ncbi:Exodeoxyribonuclease VII small subunit [Marinospirillum celere]|uniref:Exodeoxyribonuclease 7 small subunit n=1 Tax=Marinospirillum celere TaxID=1122252 RepID=A0A1I1JH17_9GAMM|nr:exodeoxyribonuclease VII small subunit [Marinospirillum celere]SFC47919.1 Exodeoxyribonuclease VII small subunit [Marinospirillum celere]